MLELLKKLFPSSEITVEDLEKYKEARGLYIKDPWERVKTIFQLDQFRNFHPELLRAIQAAQLAFIVGGVLGGVKESAKESREFIRTNDTNVYFTEKEMYKKMANRAILGMGTGIFKFGPRLGLFVGCFTLAASCCEAYRNKSGIIEYTAGGFVAGGLARSFLGIKGFIAGGTVGAIIGSVCGALHVLVEKLSGQDALVLKYAQYAYIQHRKQLFENLNVTNELTPAEKLASSLHGEHVENPLDKLDKKDENKK